jgi:hypothetical protein
LDYGRQTPHATTFRRVRAIYGVGVGLTWVSLLVADSFWPGTTDLNAPGKAEVFMAEHVIGGTALAWLILGLMHILRSAPLIRNWPTWFLVAANVISVLPLLSTTHT